MKEFDYSTEDCIIALATPFSTSPLAVLRVSGEGSLEAAAPLFRGHAALDRAEGGKLLYGWIVDPRTGARVDEITAVVYRKGMGYTGEEGMELFVHGSLPGIQRVLDVFREAGFRDAAPGEFTFRAFLNKKMDLTRAEAVHELITAKSKQAQQLALNRLAGGVEAKIREIAGALLTIMAGIEVRLDYPEDELDDSGIEELKEDDFRHLRERLETLLTSYRVGKIYQEGIPVTLAGKTNAGKSSLFNLFLKEDRSIVSEFHGTTRDYLDSWISIRGVPVRLYDTAGLRSSRDAVEREGIRRTEQLLEQASMVIYLVDAAAGLDGEEEALFQDKGQNRGWIFVWNKVDISPREAPEGFLPLSVLSGEGFQELEEALLRRILEGEGVSADQVVIDSERQKELLQGAAEALLEAEGGVRRGEPLDLVASDVKEALDCLGRVTGEVPMDDILTEMFSRFCVGK